MKMTENKFKHLKEEERVKKLKDKAKADIVANPIPENAHAMPATIKAIKIRVENIEKLLGLR